MKDFCNDNDFFDSVVKYITENPSVIDKLMGITFQIKNEICEKWRQKSFDMEVCLMLFVESRLKDSDYVTNFMKKWKTEKMMSVFWSDEIIDSVRKKMDKTS